MNVLKFRDELDSPDPKKKKTLIRQKIKKLKKSLKKKSLKFSKRLHKIYKFLSYKWLVIDRVGNTSCIKIPSSKEIETNICEMIDRIPDDIESEYVLEGGRIRIEIFIINEPPMIYIDSFIMMIADSISTFHSLKPNASRN